MIRDYEYDPYDAFNDYLKHGRHKLADGTVKSIATMARDLQCRPDLRPGLHQRREGGDLGRTAGAASRHWREWPTTVAKHAVELARTCFCARECGVGIWK